MRTPILALLVALCSACAAAGSSVEPATAPAAVQTQTRGFGPWTASVAAEHPLVGTAWSVAEGRALSREELEQRVGQARFVLLGETHDHPDHHRLQGELIASAIAKTPGPAVAYEMLDPAAQAQIDAFVAAGSGDVDAFAELVAWADSGWPAWSLYRPAFAPVIEAGLPILAAQFPRAQSRRFMSEGLAMLPAELVQRYGLDRPLPPELHEPLLDEMFASHCEQVPHRSHARERGAAVARAGWSAARGDPRDRVRGCRSGPTRPGRVRRRARRDRADTRPRARRSVQGHGRGRLRRGCDPRHALARADVRGMPGR